MSLLATSNSNNQNQRKYELAPAGTHQARCFAVIDMGTQQQEYLGQPKDPAHKILIYFELVNTNFVFDEKKGPQPFILPKELTLTLNKNKKGEISNLRKMLDAWRRTTMRDQDADAGFDLGKLVGKSCNVAVIHKQKKDLTMKAEISTVIAPLMVQNMQNPGGPLIPQPCPALRNEKVFFSIGNPDQFQMFDKLYGWVRDKVCLSPEFIAECTKIGKTPAQVNEEAKQRWMAANNIQPSNNNQPVQQQYQQPMHNPGIQPNQNFVQQPPVSNPGQPQQRSFNQPPQSIAENIAANPDDLPF